MVILERGSKEKNIKAKLEPNLPNLPEEIILNILSRLPLKSLIQFTCVSKQWGSLIQGFAKSVQRKKVFVCIDNSINSIDEEGHVESILEPKEKFPPHFNLEIFGSCNGLLLILISDDLFLWNPLTRCSEKVMTSVHRGYYAVSGLCFDSSNNEYKVVMAIIHDSTNYGGKFVKIGSFRNKTWTSVYEFPYHVCSMISGPVVNGYLHWFVFKESSDNFPSHQIIYFDPRIDEFKEVPMPQPKHVDGYTILGLGDLNGCLCMSRFNHSSCNFVGNKVEVLVMKEYGMESSWIVLFSIEYLSGKIYDYFVPLCSTKNDEVIMKIFTGLKGYIRAYNPNDNSHRDILNFTHRCSLEAIMYEESLVVPPDYNFEKEESEGKE
ncbi:F-box/kelch-repeat protein At3g23880-like [Camellia sinensis]|uniref:F-box/kelch-repeat protein At3g23880-like n=1 Tax=Camellia sinensis TaxID=4442 RepID=UPI0010365835|nr:F-box/kelch-repeat protein At3g23880-like [Camellia sinensis]